MCGICGFNFEDRQLAKAMADSIRHRGPDSDGIYTDKNISLGFRRLKIIDLSAKGNQPMIDKNGNVLIFNGEIYNFLELRKELESKGYKFFSDTDSEVILHAYEEYGKDCLKFLDGMFAFAIWSPNEKELFLARDRIGVKPLYYYHKNGKFFFASEIKAILQCRDAKRVLNKNCLKQVILYAYPINNETFFKDIYELKPGHFLALKNNKITIRKYWGLKTSETDKNEDFYIKALTKLLFQSVKRRLISDVPLGISLSGGIDSSTLAAIASRLKEDPIKTFTIGFDIPDDEYRYARTVAEHCSTEHTEIHLSYEDLTKAFAKVLWHYEIPYARPALLPIFYLTNKIREKLTVSISGEGSDELFAGYNRYDAYTRLPEPGLVKDKEYYKMIKRKIGMPLSKKIEYISSGVFNTDKEEFFSKDLVKMPKHIDARHAFGPYMKNTKNDGSQLNKALLYELKTEIPYFHCKKLDKMSMANSHEIRVPYLDDYNIVEFAMSIPSKYKFYGTEKKIILQKVAKPLLPKEIVKRRKLPMVVPMAEFYEKELADISKHILSENSIKKRSYYKISRIKKLITDIKSGKVLADKNSVTPDNPYRQLLFLTNLELWIKLFIENDNLKNPNLSINAYL